MTSTSTIGPSKDYATPTLWEADTQGTYTEIVEGLLYRNTGDVAYTDQPVFSGSVSAIDKYRVMRAADGEEFNFDWGSPAGVRFDPNTSGHVMQVGESYMQLWKLGITNSSPASSDEGIRILSGCLVLYIEKLHIHGFSQADGDGIYVPNQNFDITAKDCTFTSIHRAGMHFQHYSGDGITHVGLFINCAFGSMGTSGGNNTFDGKCVGVRCNGPSSTCDVELVNCFNANSQITGTSVGLTASGSGTVTFTGDYNIDEKANLAASGFPDDGSHSQYGAVAKREADLTTETGDYLVVQTWDDLHIVLDTFKTYTNIAMGTGIGPLADARVPSTDIDGDPRIEATADVGADELPRIGAAIKKVLDEIVQLPESVVKSIFAYDPTITGNVDVTLQSAAVDVALAPPSVSVPLEDTNADLTLSSNNTTP